jgi:hypothetical protein
VLRRLILYAVVGAIAALVYSLFKRAKARQLPRIPERWRELAQSNPLMREALDLHTRLEGVIDREDPRLQRALMLDVHAILESIADLVRAQDDLESHIRSLRAHPAGRRAGRPMPAPEKRQRTETVSALEARADRLAQETHQAVSGLRQVYLEMLKTFEAGGQGGAEAVSKTRSLIEDLRAHAQAEREIHDMLRDSESDGPL